MKSPCCWPLARVPHRRPRRRACASERFGAQWLTNSPAFAARVTELRAELFKHSAGLLSRNTKRAAVRLAAPAGQKRGRARRWRRRHRSVLTLSRCGGTEAGGDSRNAWRPSSDDCGPRGPSYEPTVPTPGSRALRRGAAGGRVSDEKLAGQVPRRGLAGRAGRVGRGIRAAPGRNPGAGSAVRRKPWRGRRRMRLR